MVGEDAGKICRGWWKNLIDIHVPVLFLPKLFIPRKMKISLTLRTLAKRMLSARDVMSHLMKLAEALRDIAEECSKTEIEQALGLCAGFADRVCEEPQDAAEYPEPLVQSIATKCSRLPN